MVSINKNHLLMFLFMIISILLCIGHVLGNTILVALSMIVFMGAIIWTSITGKVLYMLCFFIPWAPLVKFQQGTISLYTIGLIVACILTWVRYRIIVQKYMLPATALIMLMLIVRLFYGFGMDNSYIMFCIMLLLFPIMGLDLNETYDFYYSSLFFSIGIISAALSARFLVQYPTIARFIDVYSWGKITRYSGYYGDANFYSAHIAAALAGMLILFINSDKRKWSCLIISIILLYCGLISASKSFVITIALVLLLWVLSIFFIRRNISYKVVTIIIIAAVTIGILVSDAFSAVFNIIVARFETGMNISNLTTGRSDIWINYLQYLVTNPKALILGKGYTNVLVSGRAPHNTLLQGIYQFGFVGLFIFLIWLKDLFNVTLQHIKIAPRQYMPCAVLLVGVFLPWMGIDLLFFDEFFLMMFYISLGFRWICDDAHSSSQ